MQWSQKVSRNDVWRDWISDFISADNFLIYYDLKSIYTIIKILEYFGFYRYFFIMLVFTR